MISEFLDQKILRFFWIVFFFVICCEEFLKIKKKIENLGYGIKKLICDIF